MRELSWAGDISPATLVAHIADPEVKVPARPSRSRYDTVVAVRRSLQARLERGLHFNPRLFSDPAWDMLLELYAAALSQRRLTVTRLAERTRTPMTTALRWIATLEDEGLVQREPKPNDARAVFIVLSNAGHVSMEDYFDKVPLDAIFA